MKRYTVPMTILSTVTVNAPHRHAAIIAAKGFIENALPEQHYISGYNNSATLSGDNALIMDISGYDVESINGDEVETNPAFIVVPQCDLNADLAPESDGTRFEACEEGEATCWAVFQYSPGGDMADDLVEDYPTRAAAEACVSALEAGQPIPTPEWPLPHDTDNADPLAIIADGTVLLDGVDDTSRDGGKLFLHLADGRVIRVTAEVVGGDSAPVWPCPYCDGSKAMGHGSACEMQSVGA